MRVLKFGGSSVATSGRIRGVAEIIIDAAKEEAIIVVVSAFQGVSSQLLACAQMAAAGDAAYLQHCDQITKRHFEMTASLLPEKNAEIDAVITRLIEELKEILQGIYLLKELTLGALDHIASFGERLSANVIAAYISQQYPAEYVDARKLIITDDTHTQAKVLEEQTNEAIRHYYDELQARFPIIPIVTGFIGSTVDGRTTTLGRNSSDYTAAIVGAALEASRIEIWTDVDGIYSADPQFVHTAFIVPFLSFTEAIELSYFGAKVIHPSTLMPVIDKQIPILIKNTLNPKHPGTLIAHQPTEPAIKKRIAKSITAIDDISLLIWQGSGLFDVSRTIERLFRCLTLAHVNIFLILEGSPKHTICLAIGHKQLDKARFAIQHEFELELQHQLINIDVKPSQSIIAIIGDEMKKLSPEVAGKMFQALGKVKIGINAIVQGASERNFSLVVDNHHRARALNLIHQSFFTEHQSIALIVIGAGRVGAVLLDHLQKQQRALAKKKILLSVCAIANSKKMIINSRGINMDNWRDELERAPEHFEMASLLKMLPTVQGGNLALVDCTASDDVVASYPLFLNEGIHIITPNKRANVLPYPEYKHLMQQFKKHDCYFLCRTNVGAGLPILTVLQDLIACGDAVYRIEGILSGTLSYLFNHYDGSVSFSKVLQQAQTLGMTEPDPREDLSGLDVARKLLILARQMGWRLELSDVKVQNLVPEPLQHGKNSGQFFSELERYENLFRQRLEKCKSENKVLRYVGTLHDHKATAQLEEIPLDHPLALASHSDNIIAFTTEHYHQMPLVIKGPGAGVECTALGVYSDILKLISFLPD